MRKRHAEFAIWVFVLTLVSLSACAPETSTRDGLEERVGTDTPSVTVTSTIEPTITVSPTLTPQATPTYSVAACRRLFTSRVEGQANYQGILAGQTTEEELVELMGTPPETFPVLGGGLNWRYAGGVYIRVKRSVVTQINIEHTGAGPSLEQMLQEYGCPDLIYAIDMGEEKYGYYSATLLVYLENGVEFRFYDFPLRMSNRGDTSYFHEPLSLEQFLDAHASLKDENTAKQVSWEEVVPSQPSEP